MRCLLTHHLNYHERRGETAIVLGLDSLGNLDNNHPVARPFLEGLYTGVAQFRGGETSPPLTLFGNLPVAVRFALALPLSDGTIASVQRSPPNS
jgi:hypothetical protein